MEMAPTETLARIQLNKILNGLENQLVGYCTLLI